MSDQPNATAERPTAAARTLWTIIALLLVLGGPVLYMLLLDVPLLRVTGAAAFGPMAGGAVVGLLVARRDRRRWVRVVAGLDCVLAIGFAVAFFGLATLPDSPELGRLTTVPDFTLPDHTGRPVTLSQTLQSGPVLLVFYRGHW
ncbi:MAG: hypothetical protein ACYSVY_20925 [Planctomycetota bacterium]|jgi:Na+/proline symporter